MKTIFLKEMKLGRTALMIWCAILFLLAMFGAVEFGSMAGSFDAMVEAISAFPRIVRIAFGVDALPLNTPLGGYACMYFWSSLVSFAYAVWFGIYVIAKDERFRTSEFMYTKPFKRQDILAAKMLVGLANMLALALTTAVGSILFLLPIFGGAELLTTVWTTSAGMFFTMLVLLAIGMLSAAIAKNYKRALLCGFAALIAAYFIAFSIEFAGTVDYLSFLSPIRYFNVPSVAQNGISALYILISAIVISVALYFTFDRFVKRDLHA